MKQSQYNFNILQDSIEAAEMVRDFAKQDGDDDAVAALNYGIGRMRELYDNIKAKNQMNDEKPRVYRAGDKFLHNTVTGLVKPEMYEN